MNAEIRYYLTLFWRRLPIFLVVSLSIASAGIATALLLPPTYTARGLLLVEAPQIPTNLAQSTVSIDAQQQLAIVQRRLMTRANLLEIAREYAVYEDIRGLSPDEIVERMRNDTFIHGSGGGAGSIMTVQFSGRTGEIAAGVANEYLTRILAENADQRQQRAEGTLEFFEQEVERLEAELQSRNDEILAFQNANADALPDTLGYRMNRHQVLTERIAQLNRDMSLLQDQRTRLVELRDSGVTAEQIASSSGEPRTAAQAQLAAMRDELVSARSVYAEDSPRVQMLRARISALEEQVAAEVAPLGENDEPMDIIGLQITEVDARMEALARQLAEVESELADVEGSIERTPANAIELQSLRRDYESIEGQYNRALDRLSTAATGERIEVMNRGQRVSVIEQALPPNEPTDPNRPAIAMAGAGAGLFAGLGIVVLLEVLNKAIRRPTDLTRSLGITPIATISYISTPGERLRRRGIWLIVLLIAAAGIPAALGYVHYQVMPLDLVFDKIWARLPI